MPNNNSVHVETSPFWAHPCSFSTLSCIYDLSLRCKALGIKAKYFRCQDEENLNAFCIIAVKNHIYWMKVKEINKKKKKLEMKYYTTNLLCSLSNFPTVSFVVLSPTVRAGKLKPFLKGLHIKMIPQKLTWYEESEKEITAYNSWVSFCLSRRPTDHPCGEFCITDKS